MSKTYVVGQVLYVIPEGKRAVAPVQVIEEIKTKTLDGEKVSYIVAHGAGENAKTYDMSQLAGELFDSANDVKTTLIKRSTQQLSEMVDEAVKRAATWYSAPQTTQNPDQVSLDEKPKQQNVPQSQTVHKVRMPDGEIVSVDLGNSVK